MPEDNSADVSNDEAYENMNLVDTPMDATPESSDTSSENAEDKAEGTETTTETETTEVKDTETTEEQPSTEPQQPEETSQEKGKPDPELARQAYLQRQQTRQAVERQVDQVYGPKTEEQLIEEGLDPRDAQIQALREEMQYKEQRTYIAELNASMQAEAVNVEHDFPVFNPKSPEYDPDFTQMVEDSYKTASRLQVDDNGLILNAEIPLYEYHERMAQIYNRGASRGADKGQAEALDVLARTESPGGSSQTSRGPETLEEMEERLGNMPIV